MEPARILLCDDDLLAKSWMATALRDGGFDVTEVSTVDECLQAATDQRFNIAVLDVMMPQGSLDWIETQGGFATGVAVARRLRQVCPEMKIIGISQSPAVEARQWFRTNVDGFLVKGELFVAPTAIVERIRKAIDPLGWLKTCRTFIARGHDRRSLRLLKHHLQHTLGLPPPTVVDLDLEKFFVSTGSKRGSERSRDGPKASASRRRSKNWLPIYGVGAAISASAKRPRRWCT